MTNARERSRRAHTAGHRWIRIKRAYAPASASDGCRVLVDRMWPRGISKDELRIDHWLKDAAPSASLRKWFDHDLQKWDEFRARYAAELDGKPEIIRFLLSREERRVTLVFAARDTKHNNAVALAEYLAKATRTMKHRVRKQPFTTAALRMNKETTS
ncbi:MAG: DUF488 domain-containing protein [Pirellulaceae bacterium]